MAMHTELWFPSVVWSSVIHVVDNQEFKTWAYDRKQNDVGRTVSNYGGYQSSDILPGQSANIDRLVSHLNMEVDNCARQTGLGPLSIMNIWLNINPPGSYNHLHNHVGATLSGVYYIHGEKMQGNIQFERNDGAEYHIPDVVEKSTYFTSTMATYACKTGALYVFPGWLKHKVEGNQSNTDRISISFNYGPKEIKDED
tara:strand:- start:8929 stop:9522 length:594 start_codon:yes stop_codon:yes gene_type:complete